MNLQKNTVFEWQAEDTSEKNKKIERILFIERLNGIVVTIDIFSPTANPQIRYYKDLVVAIENRSIRVLEVDPYSYLQTPDAKIPKKYRDKRDANWELISEIVELEGIKPYLACGKSISKISLRTGKARKDIYAYRRRYFQSGRIKNSLLPRYNKSGAPGKRRLGKSANDTKLGKPSNKSKESNKKIGIRITKHDERKFLRGIKRFYEKKNKRKSLRGLSKESLRLTII